MTKKIISAILVCTIIISSFAVSAGALCDSSILYGDVNGNGKLDVDDAIKALKMVAGITPETQGNERKKADINRDGVLSIYDVRQILRSASGIVNLQPTGKFDGFKGYNNQQGGINTPTEAIITFNGLLNRIKTEKPGFTKTQAKTLDDFTVKEMTLIGLDIGQTAESVTKLIQGAISKANKPVEPQILITGQNCDNIISAETETYVSKLDISTDNIYGIKCDFDEVTQFITISVALPDCELDDISDSAYADVFNSQVLTSSTSKLVDEIFGNGVYLAATRASLKNGVLTAIIDSKTANIVSYTTTYETDIYIEKSQFEIGPLLTAELRGVTYGMITTTTYNNFQWPKEKEEKI